MSDANIPAPGAFPSYQDVLSGKEAVPDVFLISSEPPSVAAPQSFLPAAEAQTNVNVRNGGVNVVTTIDPSQVERMMEERELYQARRWVVSSDSGVRF